MARIQISRLIDDLTGAEAEETVAFALDGVSYEIDLSSDNAHRLRAGLATFVAAARTTLAGPVDPRDRPRKYGSTANTATRRQNRRIREWALDNGWNVTQRGRIPVRVVDAYKQANSHSA